MNFEETKDTIINHIKEQILKLVFLKTHNIGVLLEYLPESIKKPDFLFQSASLTEFAVESRYPTDAGEISREEYLESVQLEKQVLNWATSIIGIQ